MTADALLFQHKKKSGLLARLSRAEGQVRAVKAMIEREEPCAEIAQQLAAARRALDKAYFELMACAIEQSAATHVPAGTEWEAELESLTDTLVKYA